MSGPQTSDEADLEERDDVDVDEELVVSLEPRDNNGSSDGD